MLSATFLIKKKHSKIFNNNKYEVCVLIEKKRFDITLLLIIILLRVYLGFIKSISTKL